MILRPFWSPAPSALPHPTQAIPDFARRSSDPFTKFAPSHPSHSNSFFASKSLHRRYPRTVSNTKSHSSQDSRRSFENRHLGTVRYDTLPLLFRLLISFLLSSICLHFPFSVSSLYTLEIKEPFPRRATRSRCSKSLSPRVLLAGLFIKWQYPDNLILC